MGLAGAGWGWLGLMGLGEGAAGARLFDYEHSVAGAREPLRVVLVILLREPAVRLVALHVRQAQALRAHVRILPEPQRASARS